MAKTPNTASTVEALLCPCVESLGYKLWDVEFVKEGSGYYLRVTIDSEDGIQIDDCEKVSRAISPLLDEADPIEQTYTLEVSSPGIERTLKKPEHYAKCLGSTVDIRLFSPDETGSKAYRGVLKAQNDDKITVLCGEAEKVFELSKIAKANVFFDFADI